MNDYSEDTVSFFLIDFKLDNNHSESTNVLFRWLKTQFRNLVNASFSYKFDNFRLIDQSITTDARYDVKISYSHNCLIGFTNNCCFIIDRKTKILINSFEFKGTLVFALDDEYDEIYILRSMDDTSILLEKYELSEFIRKEAKIPIYSLKKVCSNPYGLLVYNNGNTRYLIALDSYSNELKLIDCKTGSLMKQTLLKVPENGYAIELVSSRELIIACPNVISIYEIDGESFELGKEVLNLIISKSFEHLDIYCIGSDQLNGKLILSNLDKHAIMVLNRKTLEIVQTQKIDDSISGLCLDKQTGELFVCCEQKGLISFR